MMACKDRTRGRSMRGSCRRSRKGTERPRRDECGRTCQVPRPQPQPSSDQTRRSVVTESATTTMAHAAIVVTIGRSAVTDWLTIVISTPPVFVVVYGVRQMV